MGKITGVYRSSFPCKKKGCNRSFKSESERSKHNGLTHQNVTKCSLPTTGEILEVQRQEDGDFQCPICRSYESPDPSEIRKHCKSCDALPYGPISTAHWNVGAAAAPAGSGAPTTGGGDGWLPSFSHKTLPGAKSDSTASSAATMTSSQGNRPTHATKSPHHSQPLLQGRPQQIVASASVPDYAVKAPSASVAPSRSFAGVSSHVNALAGPSRPPASPARAVSNRGRRASTSSESSRGTSHYGQRPNVAVSKTARKRTAATDARQIPIYRDSALPESGSRAGADRRRSDASDRTEASDSDGGIVVISSPSSATASPQKRKRSSGLRRTASSSPSLGGAILPPRVSQVLSSTRSPQAQPTTLKRKSTSSLPTPSTGGPQPPAKRLRRSSSVSALGTDDDLFGGSDDDDDGSSAAGQISLVTQLSDQARPTSLAKVVTESYPSPEPSGGEEECGSHERAIVSGPALAPLESCRSVAPRSSPVTAGLRAPSASAVSKTTTGQEHILGFLEEMLAKGAMDVAVESNTVEWTHAGTDYEPPVLDRASIPHIAAPAPAPALVLEPAPAQILSGRPTRCRSGTDPYGRLRKLAFRVELLLGWRPLLVDKYERILAGRSKVGVLNKDFAKAFQKTLSQLKEDALEDTVDLTRDWLIRTQLAVDPSSIYDASFTGLFRDYYPPGSVGRERVSAMAAVVFEFVLRWTGHVNDLPAGLRAADLTYVDPADPSERLLVNPVPWAVAKGLIDPPCQRVAVAWRLLKDLGWWDVDPSELDHETSQDGLVDDDAVPQTAE